MLRTRRPSHPARAKLLAVVALAFFGQGCKGSAREGTPAGPGSAAQGAAVEDGLEPAPEATPFPPDMAPIVKPFKGDLDGMVKRRVVRVLTVQNPVLYFVDRGREVGIVYETVKAFEKHLNDKLGNKVVTVHCIVIPVARDQLIPRLLAGEGDIAAAALTVTAARKAKVDFSAPTAAGVREVLVTGPTAPPVASVDDLSGKEVYVRRSSSYAEHLGRLNARLKKAGKPPVTILPAPEVLEDGDILEMVNAGLVPATVVDDYWADLYVQVFPNLRKRADVVSPPVDIAWAFRKRSPKLAASVNGFLKKHRAGSLAGNVLINKYLKTTRWVKDARSDEDRRRFTAMVELFQKYSSKYAFDHLLMAAQAYQESGLDQSRRSHVGAIGVMQVMPATARDKAVNIPDIERLESNIHAGIKYNRWVVDHFFDDPALTPLNKQLLAFASYNAGPSKVAKLRAEAKASGLNPNKWFNNVELVAAKRIGRETVTYVSNIYKYYLAYQLMTQAEQARAAAKEATSR
jgi:membrane-bound lytic murein transglycosylase MltF